MIPADPSLTQRTILEAIEQQIIINDPPKVKHTLERLMNMGNSRDEAVKYIACAFVEEVFKTIEHEQSFDLHRYNANLDKLPEMPWDE